MVTTQTFFREKSILRKNKVHVLPIEKFPSLVLARNVMMLQHLVLSNFNPYMRLNTKENFRLLALKVIAVAYYERW